MDNSGKIKSVEEWLMLLSKSVLQAKARVSGHQIPISEGFQRASSLFKSAADNGSSIWWVGNGGSASVCSHLAQDTMNKLDVKSLFLGDPSLLTCMANDFGYPQVYARPLDRFAEPGDLLVAISSSGNSDNILNCVKLAKEKGMKIISLSGMKLSNKLWNSQSDVSFFIDSPLYGIVEVGHEAVLHGIIETMWLETQNNKI